MDPAEFERVEHELHESYLNIQQSGRWLESPYSISFETLSNCNAACTFCPYPELDRIGTKLDDAVIYGALDEVADGPGPHPARVMLFRVNEMFLDPRLFDFLSYVNRRLPRTRIPLFTNGSTLSDKIVDRVLALSNVPFLVVSLNDHRPVEYEATMALPFDRTLDRLRRLQQRKRAAEFEFNVVLSRVGDGTPTDRAFIEWVKTHFPEFVGSCSAQVTWVGGYPGRQYVRAPRAGCSQWFGINILADGRESFCCIDAHGVTEGMNLNRHRLLEIYNQPWRRTLRETALRRSEVAECRSCAHGVSEWA